MLIGEKGSYQAFSGFIPGRTITPDPSGTFILSGGTFFIPIPGPIITSEGMNDGSGTDSWSSSVWFAFSSSR